jgi:MFS family permease
MERNLRLYPLYQATRWLYFWQPVFLLYFASVLSPDEALLVLITRSAGVVILEVPSGYLSDRIGRRVTLVSSVLASALGAALMALTGSLWPFLIAQLLSAVGDAFNSGTDTSLLYDSLAELKREGEVGDHEARARSFGLVALGVSALVGGLLSGFDLRLGFALTALAGLPCLAIALAFREPPRSVQAAPPVAQLLSVLGRLRDGVLRWVFLFSMGMYVLNHVVYVFLQPYLDNLLEGWTSTQYQATPLVAGAVVCLMMLVSAPLSMRSMQLARRFGAPTVLLSALVLQGVIITTMGLVLHWAVVVLLLLRMVPSAVMTPVKNAVVHARLESGSRATYLSVQSLAARLAYSVAIGAAAFAMRGELKFRAEVLSDLIPAFGVGAAVLFLVLLVGARGVRLPDEAAAAGGPRGREG